MALGGPLAGPAHAQAAGREAADRFDRAVKLFEAGDVGAALAEFQAAYRLEPRFQVLYNIALAHKRLFRYGEALRAFRRYLEEGGAAIPADRSRAVQAELDEITSLVATVVVRVDGGPAELLVDGAPVGTTPLPEPLLLGPGPHALAARRAGHEPAAARLELVSGERREVVLAPRPIARAPERGTLTVATRPTGATISIDGTAVGQATWTGELNPGGHTVAASLRAHETARAEVLIAAGQRRHLELALPAIAPPPPWYKRWYVWTLVSVAAAGAATAVVVAAQPARPDLRFDLR